MRRHVASHRRAWVVLAVAAITVNEIIDRSFFDHREHVDGDVLVAIVVLLIAISVSYAVARRRAGKSTAQ